MFPIRKFRDIKLRRYVRAFQSYFPALLEAKAWAQRRYRLTCKRPFEPDFEVLEGFSVGPREVLIDAGANRGQSIDAIKMFAKHYVTCI